jgi:hypothetical protein
VSFSREIVACPQSMRDERLQPADTIPSQSWLMHSTPYTQVWTTNWRKQAGLYIRGIATFVLLALPSLWLLTQPFPWISGLEAMALGTAVPVLVFGLIGGLRLVWKSDAVPWVECAAITLCFVSLQAYIFNTALHPANRFNLIGGLLPNADPSVYLSLANQWSDGIRVVTPQTTRQFFPCFLSAMLWICHRDLKLIVSIFTIITGLLSFVAWRQIRVTFGLLGATLFLALVFFFYRCHGVGLLFTEQLGLWFALIALALMVQGLREKREALWCVGLFSLVMGLNTRAGAYFVLPLLIFYSGWIFRRGPWGWRSIILAGTVCAIGMLLNLVCYWIFFAPPRPTSNFWLCFYGMLKGGNWVTAFNEIGLDNTNLVAREKAIALMRVEPWLVLKGFLKACASAWNINMFYGIPPTAGAFCLAMKWLTAIGAFLPWGLSVARKKRAELEWFVLLMVLGTLLSLPFAPPWDGGFRVYAVAFPFIYLSPVMLLSWSWAGLREHLPLWRASRDTLLESNRLARADDQLSRLTQAALAILVLLATVVPLGLMLWNRNSIKGWQPQFCVPVQGGCPAKDLPSGFQIHLISDSGRTFVPWIRVSDFRKSIDGNLEKLRAPWLLDLFNDLPENTTIGTACHSNFFVIGTDKAGTSKISQRHPILNRAWHRVTYDNDYPLSPYSQQILNRPKAPPLLPGR